DAPILPEDTSGFLLSLVTPALDLLFSSLRVHSIVCHFSRLAHILSCSPPPSRSLSASLIAALHLYASLKKATPVEVFDQLEELSVRNGVRFRELLQRSGNGLLLFLRLELPDERKGAPRSLLREAAEFVRRLRDSTLQEISGKVPRPI